MIASSLAEQACLPPGAFSSSSFVRPVTPRPEGGAVATAGYVAFLVGPPALGFLADHVGLRLAMIVVLVLLAAAALEAVTVGLTGSSLGRAAFGIRTVGVDGVPVGAGRALLRAALLGVTAQPVRREVHRLEVPRRLGEAQLVRPVVHPVVHGEEIGD